MNKPYPPTPPKKLFGGEELSRISLYNFDTLPFLNQEKFDFIFIRGDDFNGSDDELITVTKFEENPNYQREMEQYKALKEQYSKDYKAWKAFERERKKEEKLKKAVEQKDQDYQLYLKLKKRYDFL